MAFRICSYTAILVALLVGGTAFGQTYSPEGDAACSSCHSNDIGDLPGIFPAYRDSGHPHKLTLMVGDEPLTPWPFTPNPWLPASLEWNDVLYVIGNYYWKARFVKSADGNIYTGDDAQFNLVTGQHVPYHSGEVKPFNCGRCHTTGYQEDGHKHGLDGIIGTWVQEGVRCESCHGPAQEHIESVRAGAPAIYPPREQDGGNSALDDEDRWKDCDECHYRDDDFRMPWKGGFMRHHQQAEDLKHSPHFVLSCTACHDPHRSVVFGLRGIKKDKHCTDCHDESEYEVGMGMSSLSCIDCHMPFMGKSAVAFSDYEADIRGHIFQIMTDPVAAVDNTYEDGETTFWNQEPSATNPYNSAFITLDYACLKCHEHETLEWAAEYAKGIHNNEPLDPIGDIYAFGFSAFVAGDLWTVEPGSIGDLARDVIQADQAYAAGDSVLTFWHLVYAYLAVDGETVSYPDKAAGPATDELAQMIYEALFQIW